MAVSLKHTTQTAEPDSMDGKISADAWNEEHTLLAATDKLLGRISTGTGAVEEVTCTDFAQTLLDDVDAATARTTLGVGAGDSPTLTALTVSDEVYGIGWDADLTVPTKNALYDKIETIGSGSQTPWTGNIDGGGFDITNVDDASFDTLTVTADPYAVGWNGSNLVPTKDAVYDKIESLSSVYQPLDSDLTAIAALTTTSYGRGLLALANATALAAEVDSFFLTPTEGNAAYQPLDSDLTTIAGLTATTDNFVQSKASAWASRTPTQVTADLIAFVGDTGTGGIKGLVPAPAAADAPTKFLMADGTWAVPSGSGGVSMGTVVASIFGANMP